MERDASTRVIENDASTSLSLIAEPLTSIHVINGQRADNITTPESEAPQF